MKYSEFELVKIRKDHFNEVILPELMKISIKVVDNMIIFIEGSVSYESCKKSSSTRIDYYINIDINEDLLRSVSELLGSKKYLYKSVRVSYVSCRDHLKFDLILKNDMDKFWIEFPPFALNKIRQAVSIWDPKSLMPIIQQRVECYPWKC